jgi:hypothetical protein
VEVLATGGGINSGIKSAIRVTRAAAPPAGFPPPAFPQHGDSGGPLLCGGLIAGSQTATNSDGYNYFTALDSDPSLTLDTSWITNVAADYVNEPLVSAITGGPNAFDLFVRGTDGQVFHKWSTGTAFGPSTYGWEPLGGYITGTPEAVTWGGNRIDVFARGGDSNPATDNADSRGLWQLAWTGSNWGWYGGLSADSGGNGPNGYGPTSGKLIGHPSAVAWRGVQHLAVFGVDANQSVDYNFWDGSSWSSWSSMTHSDADTGQRITFLGPLKAVDMSSINPWGQFTNTAVFAVGTNHALYIAFANFVTNSGSGNTLSGWTNLGGYIQGGVSVVVNAVNAFDVFVKSNDNRVYHKAMDTSLNWYPSQSDWEPQYGNMQGTPAATSYGPGKLTLLAGSNTVDELDYKAWFGNGWVPSQSSWYALGDLVVESPTLLAFPGNGTSGNIDAFTVSSVFTVGVLPYSTSGPSATYGWYGDGSIGGTVSPW